VSRVIYAVDNTIASQTDGVKITLTLALVSSLLGPLKQPINEKTSAAGRFHSFEVPYIVN
jgi:hypothetical protein